MTRFLPLRRLDERDRVARRVQDVVAPEDQRGRRTTLGTGILIAAAAADRLERDTEAPGSSAQPVDQRGALVGRLEGVAAAADDVEVQVCDEALDAPGRHRHAAGVALRSEQAFLLARPGDEDDGPSQLSAPRRERPSDLDGDGRTRSVGVGRGEKGAVWTGADAGAM